MAVEAKRGCGYRKRGGLYLVSKRLSAPCGRLPFPLTTCSTCGAGYAFSRAWTWVNPAAVFTPPVYTAGEPIPIVPTCNYSKWCPACPVYNPFKMGDRAGLLWIGATHYPNPDDFAREASALGVSRRIKAVPRGFKLGETWVLLAHIKAGRHRVPVGPADDDRPELDLRDDYETVVEPCPGIFSVFLPSAIEKIVSESEAADDDAMDALKARGITPVAVPDDDEDHA